MLEFLGFGPFLELITFNNKACQKAHACVQFIFHTAKKSGLRSLKSLPRWLVVPSVYP